MQQPDLTNIRVIKQLLASHGIRPNKTLGQHFLVSKNVLANIVEAAELTKNDVVLEVGPGLGTLTVELARHAKRVVAVEKDRALLPILRDILSPFPNAEIVHDDILKFNPLVYKLKPISPDSQINLSKEIEDPRQSRGYKLIADLPYYLTSRFLRLFLESPHQPSHMVLLVQKEVARRICEKPPHASILSNAVQYYAVPKIALLVTKSSFFPAPTVDSAVIKLSIMRKFDEKTDKKFMDVLKKSFSSPRKQIVSNLSRYYARESVIKWLKEAKIGESQRAQEIFTDQWIILAGLIHNNP